MFRWKDYLPNKEQTVSNTKVKIEEYCGKEYPVDRNEKKNEKHFGLHLNNLH